MLKNKYILLIIIFSVILLTVIINIVNEKNDSSESSAHSKDDNLRLHNLKLFTILESDEIQNVLKIQKPIISEELLESFNEHGFSITNGDFHQTLLVNIKEEKIYLTYHLQRFLSNDSAMKDFIAERDFIFENEEQVLWNPNVKDAFCYGGKNLQDDNLTDFMYKTRLDCVKNNIVVHVPIISNYGYHESSLEYYTEFLLSKIN